MSTKARQTASLVSSQTGIGVTISGDPVVLGVGSTELVRVTGGGSVGIGVTNPSSKLHVEVLSNNADIFEVSRFTAYNSGDTSLRIFAGSSNIDTDLRRVSIDSYRPDTNVVPICFTQTTSAGTTERLRISSTGNIGIGTDDPSGTLDVRGPLFVGEKGSEDTRIEVGSGRVANGYAYLDLIGDTTHTDYGLRVIRDNGGENTSSGLLHRGTGELYLNSTDAGSITFSTSNAQRVKIASNGLVGFGTNNPGERIDVDGNIRLRAGNFTTYATKLSAQLNATHTTSLESYQNSGTPYELIGSYADSGGANPRVVLAAGGQNVGIGTDNPDGQLTIRKQILATDTITNSVSHLSLISNLGGSNAHQSVIHFGPRNASTNMSPAAISAIASGNTASDLAFYVNANSNYSSTPNTEALRIANTGNIGIGSISPGRKLDVADSGANGSVIRSRVTTNNGGYLAYEALNSSGSSVFSVTHNGRINLSENIVFASGQGIDFSATADGGTSSSELFDDYEEGSFTPTVAPTSGSFSTAVYSDRLGYYRKVGSVVYIQVRTNFSSFNVGSASGQPYVTGLPFTPNSNFANCYLNVGQFNNWTNAPSAAIIDVTNARILFLENSNNPGFNNDFSEISDMGSTSENRIQISGWYVAA